MIDIKVYAKTAAAFAAGVIANMATDLVNGTAPWPQTGAEWSRYLITSFGAALGAFAVRNKITQAQIDKQADIIGAVVVPEVARQASQAAEQTVKDVAAMLPTQAREAVEDVSTQVGSVVDQVIRDYQSRARK